MVQGPTPYTAGSGDALYDANRLYGQVLYVAGLETDRPLAITRNHYADASKTSGSGSVTYAVYAPFSIVPLWNSQGRADLAVFGGTAAPGQDYLCTDTGKTRCAEVFLDQGVFPYARSGGAMGSWNGTVLIDKADATGTYYRRNRTYDPSTSRFTQEDPIGLAGGINEYGFASGDPVNYSDPFGLCPDPSKPWCSSPLYSMLRFFGASDATADRWAGIAYGGARIAGAPGSGMAVRGMAGAAAASARAVGSGLTRRHRAIRRYGVRSCIMQTMIAPS